MELQLEELEADAGEDELDAEIAASASTVRAFERKRPSRKPFPEHLPRERVVIAAPASCPCCGSAKLSKLGEDITETLEVIPRQWKVIQTVREKFSCRECEKITQPPAPSHVTPRGFIGPNLLAMILFEKFAQHQPLNRQSERYAREGIDLSLSTLADQVGACAAALKPIHSLIEAYVLAAERLHGDDTTVPILAKGKTDTGRIWTYVRDDRPFGGLSPPAALFYATRDLRSRRKLTSHILSFHVGLKAVPRERRRAYGRSNRLLAFLEAMTAAAELGMKEIVRLSQAREQMERHLRGRRSSSNLPAVIELLLSRPILSAPMIAKSAKVTPRAALNLVAEIGVREITGRGRYRAWGVI